MQDKNLFSRSIVSIIITNYNYAKYLAEAIDSALSQSYTPKEVVVVDDGSSDDSISIISSYGNQIIAVSQNNAGQGAACITGFLASHGKLVIFLDADDILHPDAAAEVVKNWHEGASKLQFSLESMDEYGQSLGECWPKFAIPKDGVMRLVRNYGFYPSPPMSGNSFSREFLSNVLTDAIRHYRICADTYLKALAPLYGDIISVDAILGRYRIHGENNFYGSISSISQLRLRLEIELWVEEDLKRHAKRLGRPLEGELSSKKSSHCKMRFLVDRNRGSHAGDVIARQGLNLTLNRRHPQQIKQGLDRRFV